jgi:cysteine desulfurase
VIYLDYQATTPLALEAWAAMEPWLNPAYPGSFANPHSAHVPGRAAAAAISVARDQVAALLPPGGRVIFTSGATEAINLAIQGSLQSRPIAGRNRIITLATEHAAVLDSCKAMAARGYIIDILPVAPDGLAYLGQIADGMTSDVALVAVMQVNNEIGVIQPVDAIADLCRAAGVLFLCDAVQSYGRMIVPQQADMIAVSAHKIHGPKGIGALWLRDQLALDPLIHGGGQEMGLRSGTLSPALCAGFGAAAELAAQCMAVDAAHVAALWNHAAAHLDGWTINGAVEPRYKGNLNIRRDGLDVARLMSDARDIAFSAGSACASGSGRPSHVLSALGLEGVAAKSSIRLGFGRYTTKRELDDAINLLNMFYEKQLTGI